MPPCIDTYVLLNKRSAEQIDHFINLFVKQDVVDIQRRNISLFSLDEKGQFLPEDRVVNNSLYYGLNLTSKGYSLYLDSMRPDIYRVIISYTLDEKLLLGASFDGELVNAVDLSKKWLIEIENIFDFDYGVCMTELPPPINFDEFLTCIHSKHALISYERRNGGIRVNSE